MYTWSITNLILGKNIDILITTNSTSPGIYVINLSIARSLISLVATPLAWIFNSSFNLGLITDSLKIDKITPIFKLGPQIYQTILILISALLSPTQFGFQRGKSMYLALLNMQTCISEAMNSNKYSLGVFSDISKAFDAVNHSLLINKLELYGIQVFAKNWFVDYLTNLNQLVSIKEIMSSFMNIASGVPQGSILGPILFLLYLNDLGNVLKN